MSTALTLVEVLFDSLRLGLAEFVGATTLTAPDTDQITYPDDEQDQAYVILGDAFSDWLTSERNPRFTINVANRLWKHVFGLAQIEPGSLLSIIRALREGILALDADLRILTMNPTAELILGRGWAARG